MSFFTLYLLTVLPNLSCFFAMLTSITAIVPTVLIGIITGATEELKHLRWLGLFIPLSITLGLISNLIPNEKQMYTLVGGYYVTNIEGIDKLPKNIVGAANKFIETYTEESKGAK